MKPGRFPLLVPTPVFGGLLFVLAAMWYAGASQNNAAAYLLCFLTAAIFLVSLPQTLLNLRGLAVHVEAVKPAFVGNEISIPVEILNQSRRPARGIAVSLSGATSAADSLDEIAGGKAARVTLCFPATARGEFDIERVQLASVFPLGFVKAKTRVPVHQRYLVFPKPEGDPVLPAPPRNGVRAGAEFLGHEGDDFAGVRTYVVGESQRHVDWKAVARGQPMMTKQFAAETDDELIFELGALSPNALEARLSQLALWIVVAERGKRSYGLRLPGLVIAPASGVSHYYRCLRELSIYR